MNYLCIHGHFYQPPRENPWLEAIEMQDSAYPYHDWNERITAECYAPNAAARILDGQNRIVRIVNNYSKLSFNVGPTLLSWMKDKAAELYAGIQQADRESQELFGGHGSAIAQAYNHMIMPLANRRDKDTQIKWGIADFRARFGREPEGMWLPETAVDLESLDLMAQQGIRYTILAPSQAKSFRPLEGNQPWVDVSGAKIDPTRAYRVRLREGRHLDLFFYDGPISRAVAFEKLLNNGETFAKRLLTALSPSRTGPQLAHIATDGETYGHHHRYGEMALAYALHHIESTGLAQITNYGQFLELHPPEHEVEIYENTAWSCAHGVGRWMTNCGCNGGRPNCNQSWRAPLRAALDWLRDTLEPLFESELGQLVADPWAARDGYIDVMLDRSPAHRAAFIERYRSRPLTLTEEIRCWKLLEMQRHAMLMYTSCGWFFDELSGIETVQVIEYAGRVVQLAEELFDQPFEPEFLRCLALAKSNLPELRDGAHIYQTQVKPNIVDLRKVAAHYGITSLFQDYPEHDRVYCYSAERQDYRSMDAGRLRLAFGRARFVSEITQESGSINFGVVHFGDHNLTGGVSEFRDAALYREQTEALASAFVRADLAEVIRELDRAFGVNSYSLKSLFRDEQRHILNQVLASTLDEVEALNRTLYENHAPLMRFLGDLKAPLPKELQLTAEYTLNRRLNRAFATAPLNMQKVQSLLAEARGSQVNLDATTLEYTLRKTLERIAGRLQLHPSDLDQLHRLLEGVTLARSLPFPVTLWTVQNICHDLAQWHLPLAEQEALGHEAEARQWLADFRSLLDLLTLA